MECPQKLTNVIQTSQNSPWLSLRSLNKWYGVFAPQYKNSHSGLHWPLFPLALLPKLAAWGQWHCIARTAARQDNRHIVSMAASLALALRAGRSTLAVAGVFGAGKTRSLSFLLAWLALTTHLKIAVVHKENPAGRAITKLLTAFDLEPDHQRYFIRPVGRKRPKPTQRALPVTCVQAMRHHTSLAATL